MKNLLLFITFLSFAQAENIYPQMTFSEKKISCALKVSNCILEASDKEEAEFCHEMIVRLEVKMRRMLLTLKSID